MILPPMILPANLVEGQSAGDPPAEPAILPPNLVEGCDAPLTSRRTSWDDGFRKKAGPPATVTCDNRLRKTEAKRRRKRYKELK